MDNDDKRYELQKQLDEELARRDDIPRDLRTPGLVKKGVQYVRVEGTWMVYTPSAFPYD